MPTFNLGRLGRFQVSRLPPSRTSSPTEHHDISSSLSPSRSRSPSQPPKYTDVAGSESESESENYIKYRAPSQAQPPQCKTEQARRWLIEIVAITFNADFDELNAALYTIPTPSNTNTILSDAERADLLAQSDLVRKNHAWYLNNGKTKIYRKDEEKLCTAILGPV
jgi:hypothetical protein